MQANPGERLLAAELVAVMAISWAAEVFKNRQNLGADPLGAAPKPQVFLPQIGAYAALGLVALFGPGPARVAAGLGGLVALVVILKSAGILFTTSTAQSPSGASGRLFTPPPPAQGVALA